MTKTTCPYCLSELVAQAEVCKHCGREVYKILTLEAKLKKAKEEIKRLETLVEPSKLNSHVSEPDKLSDGLKISLLFFLIVLFFQIIITAFLNVTTSFMGLRIYTFFSFIAIGVLIYSLLWRNKSFNIWHILIFFSLQPYLAFYLINLLNPEALTLTEIRSIINTCFINFAGVLFFSIVMIFFKRPNDYYYVFSFGPLIERFTVPLAKLERIDKIGLLLLSIGGTIVTVYKIFF